MLKLVAFFKRRNGPALEAFQKHWRIGQAGRLPFVITEAHEIEVR